MGDETACAPKCAGAHGAFGRIFGRFCTFNPHKGPQKTRALENPFARAFHLLLATVLPLAQKVLDLCTQSPRVLWERSTLQCPASQATPPLEYLAGLVQQRYAGRSGLAFVFTKGREITAHVRPTPLPNPAEARAPQLVRVWHGP